MILHQGRSIYRIHVGGINYSTTVPMLRRAFEKFGTVLDGTEIIYDKEGRSKGFGFVNFAEESAFKKAIEQMNGRELDGRTISVTSAQPERKHNETTQKRRNGGNTSGGLRQTNMGPFPFRAYRVTVYNLHPSVTWRDLKDFLREGGEVQYAEVKGPGVGIGEFATAQERANVIRQLNGKELKGNQVVIRNLNEQENRFHHHYHHHGSRPNGHHCLPTAAAPPNYFPEQFEYGPNPHQTFEGPYYPGFEPCSYTNGARTPGPVNNGVAGPMEFNPVGFAPPPGRLPPWNQTPPAGRGAGRGYPQFVPPFPPPNTFPRGHVRPVANNWMFPSGNPVRPCLPGRGFERPPPPSVYSQTGMPAVKQEYEHPGEVGYQRSPSAVADLNSVEQVGYQKRPTVDREYSSYPISRHYNTSVSDSSPREKPNVDYNRSKDEWSSCFRYPSDSQNERNGAGGPYVKYEGQSSGGSRPLEKSESGGSRVYTHHYPVRNDDLRMEYPEYGQSRSVIEERRKEYSRSGGYTGYLNSSSYTRSTSEQTTGGYDYTKTHRNEDYMKYRMEDYSHNGDGYLSSEAAAVAAGGYSKDPPDYDYPPRTTNASGRSYGSEYDTTRDGQYYSQRTTDYPERSYRDDDPRGAGGAERTRQRTHRTGPYDH